MAAYHIATESQFLLNATNGNNQNLNYQKSFEIWNQSENFQKLELIASLSDQHKQLFCRTDTVFASLGCWSSKLFQRLMYVSK